MKLKNFLIILPLLFSGLTLAEYRQGVDYRIVSNPLPVKKDGIVEVVEVFWYECGACYNFNPVIRDWSKKQDNTVKFSKMPVTWQESARNQAALFYTIEALEIGRAHV